jgi:hypothetical protein
LCENQSQTDYSQSFEELDKTFRSLIRNRSDVREILDVAVPGFTRFSRTPDANRTVEFAEVTVERLRQALDQLAESIHKHLE